MGGFPDGYGNGGITLRTKSVILNCLDISPHIDCKRRQLDSKGRQSLYPEDIYIIQKLL